MLAHLKIPSDWFFSAPKPWLIRCLRGALNTFRQWGDGGHQQQQQQQQWQQQRQQGRRHQGDLTQEAACLGQWWDKTVIWPSALGHGFHPEIEIESENKSESDETRRWYGHNVHLKLRVKVKVMRQDCDKAKCSVHLCSSRKWNVTEYKTTLSQFFLSSCK